MVGTDKCKRERVVVYRIKEAGEKREGTRWIISNPHREAT